MNHTELYTRIARIEDWQRIIEIYNQSILESGKTADTEPQTLESRSEWLQEHLDEKYPILLAELNGQIIGWCSLSKYRPGRKALESTAEISYYLDKNFQGVGFGTRLIEETINYAKDHGIKNLMAILLDINKASSKILTKFGFEKWGHLPNIAEINGSRCGQFIFGKNIME
ncbi:MAG: GNAT family N-acetyltransferase [Melioribacteraceae bacterium]|nr:GNAT family N-acetyltransferase [Melioribacteraceae bacterium]